MHYINMLMHMLLVHTLQQQNVFYTCICKQQIMALIFFVSREMVLCTSSTACETAIVGKHFDDKVGQFYYVLFLKNILSCRL